MLSYENDAVISNESCEFIYVLLSTVEVLGADVFKVELFTFTLCQPNNIFSAGNLKTFE